MNLSKSYIIMFIFVIFVFLFTGSINAELEGSLDLKRIKGYTQYEIGGSYYGFSSLLEFPLNHNFIGGKLKSDILNSNFQYKISGFTNITKKFGKMKDSDWIYNFGAEGKDIYSESDAYLNRSYIFDFELSYIMKLNKNFTIIAKSGYKKQKLDYTIKDGVQYGSITETGEYISKENKFILEGELLEYKVNYKMPYLGIQFYHDNNNYDFKYGFNISPYVKATDEDDHLLRNKISYSKTQGRAYILNAKVDYKIFNNLKFKTEFDYLSIKTSGTQNQYFYDDVRNTKEFITSVSNDIESKQSNITLGFIYNF